MARSAFLAQFGILMIALQQHLKALTSRTALHAVCVTRNREPFPSELLPERQAKHGRKAVFLSVLQPAHGSTERLLGVKGREETLAELGIISKPGEVLCCLTICAFNSQATD